MLQVDRFIKKVLDKYEKDNKENTVTYDITDRVFLMIEIDKGLRYEYNKYAGGKKSNVINGKIAKAIKDRFSLEDDKICHTPKSELINSYMAFKAK